MKQTRVTTKLFTMFMAKKLQKSSCHKKKPATKGHDIPFQPHKQHAINIGLTIVCVYCKKPRVIYSKNKISKNLITKFKRKTSELRFVRGTIVEELVGPDIFTDLYVKGNLRCDAPVETIYFSAGYVQCCSHCGSTPRLSTGQNEYPMCQFCRKNKNNKPLFHRKTFTKK